MFSLRIASVDTDIVSPSVPVRWCLDKNFLEGLNLREGEELFVLLVTRQKKDASSFETVEDRQIIPAQMLERYLVFTRPGEYVIMGVPLKACGFKEGQSFVSAKSALWRNYGAGPNGKEYKIETIFHEGNEVVSAEFLPCSIGSPSLMTIDVPIDCFAPEPPAWEKKWVNLLLQTPLVDQCAFRRRRLFAYTIQPLYLVAKLTLGMACRWLAAIVTFVLGFWELNLGPLIHPFKDSFLDIWDWIDTRDNFYRLLFLWVGRAIMRVVEGPISDEERRERRRRAEKATEHQRLQVYRNLACDLEGKVATDLVPFTGKIYLFYNGFKRRVCRPFSR